MKPKTLEKFWFLCTNFFTNLWTEYTLPVVYKPYPWISIVLVILPSTPVKQLWPQAQAACACHGNQNITHNTVDTYNILKYSNRTQRDIIDDILDLELIQIYSDPVSVNTLVWRLLFILTISVPYESVETDTAKGILLIELKFDDSAVVESVAQTSIDNDTRVVHTRFQPYPERPPK